MSELALTAERRIAAPSDAGWLRARAVRVAGALLIVGTLMLAHVPRHPIGWLICA